MDRWLFGRTLAELAQRRENNFDLLRLIAALMVLITHSFALTATSGAAWTALFAGYEPSRLAVYAFFVISGFLVAGSLERRGILRYFEARALRIYPALAVMCLLTVFVLGPLLTELPLTEYMTSWSTYSYLQNIISYKTQFVLPGLFPHVPYPGTVNGSLWTIPMELFCYVLLAMLYIAGRASLRLSALLVAAVAGFLIGNFAGGPGMAPMVLFGTTEVMPVLQYGLFFFVGAVFWHHRGAIRISPLFAGVAAAGFIASGGTPAAPFLLYVWLPYLLMCLAYGPKVGHATLKKVGDLSYGTYLYAFPIQQAIMQLAGARMGPWGLSASAGICSMALAWLSWRYVESPALRLKVLPALAAAKPSLPDAKDGMARN